MLNSKLTKIKYLGNEIKSIEENFIGSRKKGFKIMYTNEMVENIILAIPNSNAKFIGWIIKRMDYWNITFPEKRNEIAKLLNIDIKSLQRAIKFWKERNVIRTNGNSFMLNPKIINRVVPEQENLIFEKYNKFQE